MGTLRLAWKEPSAELHATALGRDGSVYGLSGTEPASVPVGEYELASRLSYFLWSTMPDDELLRLAAEHRLSQPAVLQAQVTRMLRDARSDALVENFGGQWLHTRALLQSAPDPTAFPRFDSELREAMREETERFIDSLIREDRSVLELLGAQYTFVNERLARHYGIPGVRGKEFRRVSLAGTVRAGILTQASVLTVTSGPTRTNPRPRNPVFTSVWYFSSSFGSI